MDKNQMLRELFQPTEKPDLAKIDREFNHLLKHGRPMNGGFPVSPDKRKAFTLNYDNAWNNRDAQVSRHGQKALAYFRRLEQDALTAIESDDGWALDTASTRFHSFAHGRFVKGLVKGLG